MPSVDAMRETINRAISELTRALRELDDQLAADAGASAREVPHGSASAEAKMTTSPANDGSGASIESQSMAPARASGAASSTASAANKPKDS